MAEAGVPGYEASGWFGILAPARQSAKISSTRLNAEFQPRPWPLPDVEGAPVRPLGMEAGRRQPRSNLRALSGPIPPNGRRIIKDAGIHLIPCSRANARVILLTEEHVMARILERPLHLLPEQPRDSWRPTMVGRQYAVAGGHYLATEAAMRVLDRGGNAVDAGVTAAMALAVVQPDIVSFAGVAPTLIYLKEEDRVVSLAGLGWWPMGTDLDVLRKASADGHDVPEGMLRTVIPAAPATHIEALRRFGTISFEEAATARWSSRATVFRLSAARQQPRFGRPSSTRNGRRARIYARRQAAPGRRALRAARPRPHDPGDDRGGAQLPGAIATRSSGQRTTSFIAARSRHDRRLITRRTAAS